MITEWALVIGGLALLLVAGDALVKGAVNLALRLGIPALVVSLTVVAFGTSAPELLISVDAALRGAPGIAMGNVVGSNTANILLVLGLPALIATMRTADSDSRDSYIQMLLASVLFIALAFVGTITRLSALVLLAALAAMLIHAFRAAKAQRAAGRAAADAAPEAEVEGADPSIGWPRILIFLAAGIIGLPIGADLLVEGAVGLARAWGMTETAIGLSIVAIGTSLPELATTGMAARRGQADVALGNVIGSNMFNLLAIIGIAALVTPIPVDRSFLTLDLWVMLGASVLIAPFIFLRWDINRLWGVVFVALYAAYMVVVLG